MSSTGPSAETNRSRFRARACAERLPVRALRVSSTPGRTTIRYASQARFVSRSISARYASQLSFVTDSLQEWAIFPRRESSLTTWSVIAMTSWPVRPNTSTISGMGRRPSDQVEWMWKSARSMRCPPARERWAGGCGRGESAVGILLNLHRNLCIPFRQPVAEEGLSEFAETRRPKGGGAVRASRGPARRGRTSGRTRPATRSCPRGTSGGTPPRARPRARRRGGPRRAPAGSRRGGCRPRPRGRSP